MLRITPSEKVIYNTHLSEDEVLESLFKSICTAYYVGDISNNTFTIRRKELRNKYQPEIKGIVSKNCTSTQIKVEMRLHAVALIIYYFFIFASLITLYAMLKEMLSNMNTVSPLLLFIPVVLLGGAYLSFKIESRRSKKDLEKMFNAEIQKSNMAQS